MPVLGNRSNQLGSDMNQTKIGAGGGTVEEIYSFFEVVGVSITWRGKNNDGHMCLSPCAVGCAL